MASEAKIISQLGLTDSIQELEIGSRIVALVACNSNTSHDRSISVYAVPDDTKKGAASNAHLLWHTTVVAGTTHTFYIDDVHINMAGYKLQALAAHNSDIVLTVLGI